MNHVRNQSENCKYKKLTDIQLSQLEENLLNSDKKFLNEQWTNQYEQNAIKNWDLFYKRNKTNFQKNRQWIKNEFLDLNDKINNIFNNNETQSNTEQICILDLGCGVGNSTLPFLEEQLEANNQDGNSSNKFKIIASDFSAKAIDLFKIQPLYIKQNEMNVIYSCITDIRSIESMKSMIEIKDKMNVMKITHSFLFFVLSAVDPSDHIQSLRNIYNIMDNNSMIYFRDYCYLDLAQLRFANKECRMKSYSKRVDEDSLFQKQYHEQELNYFVRQDGTRSYFFKIEDLKMLCEEIGFKVLEYEVIEREIENKKENLKMNRRFVQLILSKNNN